MIKLFKFIKILLMLTPFVLLAIRNYKTNLKRPERYKQFLMPIVSLVLCIVAMIFLTKIYNLMIMLMTKLDSWIMSFGVWLAAKLPAGIAFLGKWIAKLAGALRVLIQRLNLNFWAFYLGNALLLLAYVIVKKIIITFMKGLFKDGNLFQKLAGLFYEYDEDSGEWGLIPKFGQARTFLKTMYIGSVVIGVAGILVSSQLFLKGLLTALFYPVFSVIILGELYFALDGLTLKEKKQSQVEGEDEESEHISDYSVMRGVLRRLFPDKLNAENTSVSESFADATTNEELLDKLEESEQVMLEAYGKFMRAKTLDGMELDFNYLLSGKQLLEGQSVLFNNPFYYDLIPYIFYPMNRALLRHRKVLIILGRHGAEEGITQWCVDGLTAINNIPSLWNVGVLTEEAQELDVGIITRSSVHDLKLHETNRDFFDDVEFVVLVEPSRLVTTAQVGMNSLIRHCRRKEKPLVFCSADKNCDGLLDALSHILMTPLQEVSATNHHRGASSYMIWEADEDHLQHRMLPNLSRYLGVGTEMSFAALKNQIPQTHWYGGEAFPVEDMRWIAKQYYYDLMHYAELPTSQEDMDRVFRVSADMWSAPIKQNQYLTVEDENFNMFEVKRNFSTRATDQGFVNVVCSDYLLKDYMADNESIFNADPKAIPYITADYARTVRNVVLRLCLRMSAGNVPEGDISRELVMIDLPTKEPIETLWKAICQSCGYLGSSAVDQDGHAVLNYHGADGDDHTFTADVIEMKRRFNVETGKMENMYTIQNRRFIRTILDDLRSAEYVAEDENGEQQYLGSELRGHVFQKFLPGQFFTFGGKYYEMLRVTSQGQVLVRRAADHINGRPFYRQVRNYTISDAVDSTVMGECRDMGTHRIIRQYANIQVQTPAYWNMKRYNDFSGAMKIGINGVPDRCYNHKAVLRIDLNLADEMPEGTIQTMTLLINEVLRTLLAENQDYLVAVAPGEAQMPLTYSLSGEGLQKNSIYIIEDSQMDIGLLDAVERNLGRIFSIICDYLQWHEETIQAEENVPEPEPEPEEEPVAAEPEEKKGFFGKVGKVFKKIGGFFKKIGKGIGGFFKKILDFFKKLFGIKKKGEPEEIPEDGTEPTDGVTPEGGAEPGQTPTEGGEPTSDETSEPTDDEIPDEWDEPAEGDEPTGEETPAEGETPAEEPAVPMTEKERKKAEKLAKKQAKKDAKAAKKQAKQEAKDAKQQAKKEAKEAKKREKLAKKLGMPVEELPVEETGTSVVVETPAEEETETTVAEPTAVPAEVTEDWESEDLDDGEPPVLLSATGDIPDAEEEPGDETDVDAPVEAAEGAEGDTVEYEEEQVLKPGPVFQRLPYSQRYYLRYGSEEIATTLQITAVKDMLITLGYGNSFLTQARRGKDVAQMVERDFVPNQDGVHYCDFCGCELTGLDYDILADGRERCPTCSRTAVKNVDEFVRLHDTILRNMKLFFGIRINAPVHVQMVNSKKLHKKLGKSFVPSGKADGRVLGVAIKDKNGYSILVENGSPKLQSTMTMVHEMTHIWQYLNWNAKEIKKTYGANELEVYEGMAKWVEIQYAYLLNETATAKRQELITENRDDPYGHGFVKFRKKYPLSVGSRSGGPLPFDNIQKPL